MTSDDLADYYSRLTVNFPLLLLQNPFASSDFYGYRELQSRLGGKILISSDRLSEKNLSESHLELLNSLKITVGAQSYTDVCILSDAAKQFSFRTIFSAGEEAGTEDTTISDLSVAFEADFFAGGAPCGGENTARYNRMLRIESALKIAGELAPRDIPIFFSEKVFGV